MTYRRTLFLLPILLATGSANAANRPAGYTTICNENKTCSVAANTNVAFGRADQFFTKIEGENRGRKIDFCFRFVHAIRSKYSGLRRPNTACIIRFDSQFVRLSVALT